MESRPGTLKRGLLVAVTRLSLATAGAATRTRWRVVVAVAAVLVLPATAPGTAALACQHHTGHAGTTAGHHGRQHADPVGHDAHGAHEGQPHSDGAGSSATGPDGHEDDGGQPCECAGWCPVSGGPPSPAADEEQGRDLGWTRVLRAVAPADGPPQSRFVLHLLPFANPPPLL